MKRISITIHSAAFTTAEARPETRTVQVPVLTPKAAPLTHTVTDARRTILVRQHDGNYYWSRAINGQPGTVDQVWPNKAMSVGITRPDDDDYLSATGAVIVDGIVYDLGDEPVYTIRDTPAGRRVSVCGRSRATGRIATDVDQDTSESLPKIIRHATPRRHAPWRKAAAHLTKKARALLCRGRAVGDAS